eukprot:TRINITY_DN1046_c0_g1_i1.p1 TRINITY_DN1046_c0_g1~~TRINITY_DN1046_c0_g1_i1.p1  ORF type:complete len:296 (+),score=72.74 TRINITY_DN1046_c0_g1_i1:206-1093(+)
MAQAEAEATSRPNTSGAGPDRGDESSKQKWKVLVGAGAVAVGSWFLYKRLTKKKTKEDHVEAVKKLLEGEKSNEEQALSKDWYNVRWSACNTGLKLENAPVLYQEQTLANLPKHPYRQRFYVVKPTSSERKEEVVELAHHDVLNPEPLKNWCERPESDRSEITEHDVGRLINATFLRPCGRSEKCAYTGGPPADGDEDDLLSASEGKLRGLTHMTLSKGGGVNAWDRVVNAAEAKEHGKAGTAWGPHPGGYDFKPKKAEKKKVEEKKPEDKKSSYDLPEFTSRKPDLSKSIATQT